MHTDTKGGEFTCIKFTKPFEYATAFPETLFHSPGCEIISIP